MTAIIAYCLIFTYLTAVPAEAFEGVSPRDMHVWRGEYEHALLAEGGRLDEAAYLTLAGDPDGALELFEKKADALRAGILSCLAGRFAESIALLRGEQENVYLESYRLVYLSSALSSEGRHAEAARELKRLLQMEVSPALGTGSEELLAEASYRAGIEADSMISLLGGIERFRDKPALMLADRLLYEDDEVRAREAFIRGMEAEPDTTSRRLFERLFDGLYGGIGEYHGAELADLAEAALDYGEYSGAAKVIERMESVAPGDYRARFLRGVMSEREKNRKAALGIYDEIFESDAPVSLKKRALLGSASICYDLGRRTRAAERYRLFGLYYPGDGRSSYALDMSARIYLSEELFDEAVEAWGRLRELGNGDRISREAALSEAVLLHARGHSRKAYRILKGLLAAGDWRVEPAAFYWLHETADTAEERDIWKRRLTNAHPSSFYAAAVKEGNSFFRLSADESRGDPGGVVERLERREREFVESVRTVLRPDDRLYSDEAYEALVYFLERGFIEEAKCCVGVLEQLYGSDAVAMAALYATVRSSGLVDLGLKLLWTKGLSGMESPVDHGLRYPVAYSSFVSREALKNGLPDELLLAMIREESSFDRFAVSRAGALGLMQLMPKTGSWIGRKLRRRELETEDLLTPEFNIAAGAWYMRYLLNRSGNSVVAALAYYNGGETRLSGWRKRFDPSGKPLLAIEMIGPRETRRYVKRVLDSMASYRGMAGGETENR